MELTDATCKILTLQDTASKRETEDTQVCHCLEDSLKAHTETQAQLEKSRKAHSDTSVLLDDMFHRVECMGRMIDKSHATALRTQANYAVLQTRMFEREAEYEKQQDELRTAQRQLDQKTRETTTEVNCLCQQRGLYGKYGKESSLGWTLYIVLTSEWVQCIHGNGNEQQLRGYMTLAFFCPEMRLKLFEGAVGLGVGERERRDGGRRERRVRGESEESEKERRWRGEPRDRREGIDEPGRRHDVDESALGPFPNWETISALIFV
ncbi:hypothetical protein L226DRAFT_527586 [Lentinus tigrinus ALCF2SS1-7]|uniref:uncharacterized protein n=1 Tax=Lentinus tigrinus ALCF2SS1-7 TaxID=1328758 RepID=UPI00116603AB|nr:hypothetical protein L226DRAFT_527586 [Lentinus tigrinus ALCF2SS1-7]